MKQVSKIAGVNFVQKSEKITERVEVARIYGEVVKIDAKPSRLDPTRTSIRVVGQVEAVDVRTGEEFAAAEFYPMGALSNLFEAMAENEGNGKGVQYAFRVFIQPSPSSPTGYSWDYESAVQASPSQRIAAMRNHFLMLENMGN